MGITLIFSSVLLGLVLIAVWCAIAIGTGHGDIEL